MFCINCGARILPNANFCAACGARTYKPTSSSAASQDSDKSAPRTTEANEPVVSTAAAIPVDERATRSSPRRVANTPEYAGFWLRAAALVIDYAILFGGGLILAVLAELSSPGAVEEDAYTPIVLFITWLYYALMESSARQATLGKSALGLTVTDLRGERVSFGRATGRFFAKILSGLILGIGYLMAAFTEKKQALHDMMADCLVIRTKAGQTTRYLNMSHGESGTTLRAGCPCVPNVVGRLENTLPSVTTVDTAYNLSGSHVTRYFATVGVPVRIRCSEPSDVLHTMR